MGTLHVKQLDDTWDPLGNGGTPAQWNANGLPLNGQVLMGSSGFGGNRSTQPVEAYLGVPFGLSRFYYSAGQSTATLESWIAEKHGDANIPWVSFKPPVATAGSTYPSSTWLSTAAGDNDAWLQDLADRIAAITTGPIWIAFHHEPENDDTNVPADWVAMQRHVMSFFTGAGFEHVCRTSIMAGWQDALGWGGGLWNWTDAFAGSDRIDMICSNPYNAHGSDIGTTWYEWIDNFYPSLATAAAAHGVEWGLSEYGITDASFVLADGAVPNMNGPGSEWMQRQFDDIKHPSLAKPGVAQCYFPYSLSTNTWTYESYPAKRDAFAAVYAQADIYPFA